MNEISSEFVPDQYKVKALTAEEEKPICGWLTVRGPELSPTKGQQPCVTDDGEAFWEVNPYTICVNTRIKCKDEYLYEYDLIKYQEPLGSKWYMGCVVFDTWDNSWAVRTSSNYSGHRKLRDCLKIEIIGNVILSDNDYKTFQEYSDNEENNSVPDVEPECRSKQHLNKNAKRFV